MVFRSGARKTYPLMPSCLQCDTHLGSPSHRLQRLPDLFPRKDCLHEILLGLSAVSDAHRGQQPPNFKGSSSYRLLNPRPCQRPVQKRSFSRVGTVTGMANASENQRAGFRQ